MIGQSRMLVKLVVTTFAVAMGQAAMADALCTVTSSTATLGRCTDNGCEKTGTKENPKQCRAVATDKDGPPYDDCKCVACTKKTIGVRAEAYQGIVSFDGTTLAISNLVVSNVRNLTDRLDDSTTDPVIGAVVNIPQLTYTGLKNYTDALWKYDYYEFVNSSGSQFTLTEGATSYVTADIEGLWYKPTSNAFSIALANMSLNSSVTSDYLSGLQSYVGQDDDWSTMFLWVTVFPTSDFLAETSSFTAPYTDNDSFSGTGVCGCIPEPGAMKLLGLGAVAILCRRRRRASLFGQMVQAL